MAAPSVRSSSVVPSQAAAGCASMPTGMARSMALRSARRSSGRSVARRLVSMAAMPQPMSTPTAAGAIAPRIAMTEPTVAPRPACTSAMTATWCATHGRPATFLSWPITFESTSSRGAQIMMGTLRPLIVENGMGSAPIVRQGGLGRAAQDAVAIDDELSVMEAAVRAVVDPRQHVTEDDVPAGRRAPVEAREQLAPDLVPGTSDVAAQPALGGAELVVEVAVRLLRQRKNDVVQVMRVSDGVQSLARARAVHAVVLSPAPGAFARASGLDDRAAQIFRRHHSCSFGV